jgi:DNA/RNA-binding domain of Phe-tRNA-synthetase-like protein
MLEFSFASTMIAIDPSVAAAFPDYRAEIIVADNLVPGTDGSDELLAALDARAHAACAGLSRAADHPHIAAWRAAFSKFGAKPSRYPSAAEALMTRVIRQEGTPRISPLVDAYNAVSVIHAVPIGGEDLAAAQSPIFLRRATGDEVFDGVAGVEHPRPGEIVWIDAQGVTCRRWNWRQCSRTRITHSTRSAYFVLDALLPMTDRDLELAATDLIEATRAYAPDATFARARLGSSSTPAPGHTGRCTATS